jgi:hypothetical protein
MLVVFFPTVRRSGREVEHLSLSSAQVKKSEVIIIILSLYVFMARALNTVVVEKYNVMTVTV